MRTCLFTCLLFAAVCVAEEPTTTTNKPEALPNWLRYCNTRAKTYVMRPMLNGEGKFRRIEKSILQHTQAIRGQQLGAVYLWVTQKGRPAVIGTTVIGDEFWKEQNTYFLVEEFHSLHSKAIVGRIGDREWRVGEAGLIWERLSDVPRSKSDKLTLLTVQARRVLKDFTAHAIDHHTGDQKRPLRFQPNPIYKYEDRDSPTPTTGFLFAGCLGTDPEVILCLENRTRNSRNEWYCAVAWFSDMKIFLQRKGDDYKESSRRWGREHIGLVSNDNRIPEVDADFDNAE